MKKHLTIGVLWTRGFMTFDSLRFTLIFFRRRSISFSSARRRLNTSSRSARSLNFTSRACSFAMPSRAAPRCRLASLLRLRWTPPTRSRKCVAKVGMPCCTVVVCGVMGGRVIVDGVEAAVGAAGQPNLDGGGPTAASPPAAALCAFTRLEMPRVRKALCRAVLSRQTQSDHEQGATTASQPPGGDLGPPGTGPGTRLRNPALKNTEGALRIKAARRARRPAPAHAFG